ncbi:hypothetical protein NQ315_008395 [Exocentrus adspersus]|uniref:BZIP domain-containing protein n=1 Tax=Exocentrus adspersus TaxID=1586481 RepID=A0AAV8W6W5_9CUCU|nr:hypothetical protein NQ315_008395 [Exocentrus adspersus]
MDPAEHSHYYFGEGAGATPLLPVSAFSAYSLLRNCNYLLTSQTQDAHLKSFRGPLSPDFHLRSPVVDDEKSFVTFPSKGFLSNPSTFFGYPPPIHVVPNEQIGSRSPNNSISPCPSLYGVNSSSFKRQRGEKKPIPEEQKDDKYFERRRRNNQAAKKSRDARKVREDKKKKQIALKATILEHENAILRAQVLTLREEVSSLRQMLLQKKALELATRDTQLCMS